MGRQPLPADIRGAAPDSATRTPPRFAIADVTRRPPREIAPRLRKPRGNCPAGFGDTKLSIGEARRASRQSIFHPMSHDCHDDGRAPRRLAKNTACTRRFSRVPKYLSSGCVPSGQPPCPLFPQRAIAAPSWTSLNHRARPRRQRRRRPPFEGASPCPSIQRCRTRCSRRSRACAGTRLRYVAAPTGRTISCRRRCSMPSTRSSRSRRAATWRRGSPRSCAIISATSSASSAARCRIAKVISLPP